MVVSCTGAPTEPLDQTSPARIAFVDVTVIPMNRPAILAHQNVLVRGDRIISITPAGSAPLPSDAKVIDGTGRFLLPGLAEMHAHVPPPTDDRTEMEAILFLYLANGVTTLRGMLGFPGQLALRDEVARGAILSPTLYLAGPSFNGDSVHSPADAVARVHRQKDEGWDLLKVHPGLTVEEYDAMARTAKRDQIRFGGHVPLDVGLIHALEMGQETIEHMDGFVETVSRPGGGIDEPSLDRLAGMTRDRGAWIVPTMAVWETLLGVPDPDRLRGYPELKYMPPAVVAGWRTSYQTRRARQEGDMSNAVAIAQARLKVLGVLNRAGVRILLGTDSPQLFSVPGFSVVREMERMSSAGMTPWEILKSGTANPGQYFQNDDRFGTIEPNARADLVLLSENPLEDIHNITTIEGVMVRGTWLPRSVIDYRLAKIAAGYVH